MFMYREILEAYEQAFAQNYTGTDDASLMERMGKQVKLVESQGENFKLTMPGDFARGERHLQREQAMRIGQGYDIHALVSGRPLILGGVHIPHETGLAGHSDADALVHALIDALLGAAAMGDIGELFPDTDPAYKGADSMALLAQVKQLLDAENWQIDNVDATLFLEKPKMQPYKTVIRDTLAKALGLKVDQINIKAKTAEKFGAVGRQEAIAASVTCLLHR